MEKRKSCDVLSDCIDAARDKIKSIVKEHGGWMRVEQGDSPVRTVLVNGFEPCGDWRHDHWVEAYVHALKIDDYGDLWFFADPVCGTCYTTWTDGDINDPENAGQWYCLDWDACCSYPHDTERILYYLENEDY